MSAPVQWREFVRALAAELDAAMPAASRHRLLRGIGLRMAQARPVPAAPSMDALEIEMNEILAELGWGSVQLHAPQGERGVLLNHSGLPYIGTSGHPRGAWLVAVLEGLYGGWMALQSGSEPSLTVEQHGEADEHGVNFRYGWQWPHHQARR